MYETPNSTTGNGSHNADDDKAKAIQITEKK